MFRRYTNPEKKKAYEEHIDAYERKRRMQRLETKMKLLDDREKKHNAKSDS